jgi:hypothetical protein
MTSSHGYNTHVYVDLRVLADVAKMLEREGFPPEHTISALVRRALTALRDSNTTPAERTNTTAEALEVLQRYGILTTLRTNDSASRSVALRLTREAVEPPTSTLQETAAWLEEGAKE